MCGGNEGVGVGVVREGWGVGKCGGGCGKCVSGGWCVWGSVGVVVMGW